MDQTVWLKSYKAVTASISSQCWPLAVDNGTVDNSHR